MLSTALLPAIARRQREGWQVRKVMGEATLRGVQVTAKEEEWQAERLGSVSVSLRAGREEPKGTWQVVGLGSAQRNGMAAQNEWEAGRWEQTAREGETLPKWRVAWRAGKVPLETVRAILQALPMHLGDALVDFVQLRPKLLKQFLQFDLIGAL